MFGAAENTSGSIGFGRGIGKSVTDRLNMGRLFIFNIFGCAAVLVFAVLFGLLKLYLIPAGIQTRCFLLFAAIMALSALAVYVTSLTKRTELFDKVCYSYLGVFSVVMYAFAYMAESSSAAIVMYWILMMVIGLLPIIRKEIFAVVWLTDLIPMVVLAIIRHYTAEGITSIITISIMGIVVSFLCYEDAVRKLNYKRSIDTALSEAETDPMTQLLNRRGLDRRIQGLWPHCIRQNTCVAVLMVDIDNFKKYNDTFGHAAGDECIKKVTATIRKSVKRRTDYAARVGGEEFLVFLTGIEPKLAVKWAVNLKNAIDAQKIPHAESNFNPYVSVSMGLACEVIHEGSSFEAIREEADKALYDAKYNGRACLYYKGTRFGKQNRYKKAE